MRRTTALLLAAGAFLALIAWWPLERAATAVFWLKVSDGRGPDDVAIDTLIAAHEGVIRSLTRHGPDIGQDDEQNCSWRFDQTVERQQKLRSNASLLNTAIHQQRNNMNAVAVYAIAEKSLRSLPNVALGALQGCVEGSLLAGVCHRYVARRVADAMATHQHELKSMADANDADATQMACAALVGSS